MMQIAVNKKLNRGASLLELVMYFGILGILLVSVTFLVIAVLAGRGSTFAQEEVNQNARFIISKLRYDIHRASDMTVTAPDTLVLNILAGSDVTYDFDLVGNTISKQVGFAAPVQLNTDMVDVTGLFTDKSFAARSRSVGVVINVAYKDNGNPDFEASAGVNTVLELRAR